MVIVLHALDYFSLRLPNNSFQFLCFFFRKNSFRRKLKKTLLFTHQTRNHFLSVTMMITRNQLNFIQVTIKILNKLTKINRDLRKSKYGSLSQKYCTLSRSSDTGTGWIKKINSWKVNGGCLSDNNRTRIKASSRLDRMENMTESVARETWRILIFKFVLFFFLWSFFISPDRQKNYLRLSGQFSLSLYASSMLARYCKSFFFFLSSLFQ